MAKKDRRLKIMWQSNAPWAPSGYGVFTRDLALRLKDDGWDISLICFFGLDGHPIEWRGIKCYPKMHHAYGADALYFQTKEHGADVVFTMQDTPLLDPKYLNQLMQEKIPWIPYTPIHYTPPSPFVQDRIRFAYKILTFSEYGRKGLEDVGYSSTMIKEGTDTEIFKPMDKKEIRKKLNINPDIFLFGMIGANKEIPTRKGFQEAMDAFAEFVKEHPNSGLFIHTLHPPHGAFDIHYYAKLLGIRDHIITPDNYNVIFKSDSNVIAKELNAFDVLLQPSRTEGFGLPVVEAQACGVPVIVTDFSAPPELIIKKKTGTTCKIKGKSLSHQKGYWADPDEKSLYKQMKWWYNKLQKDGEAQKVAKDCREHILTNYSIDDIFKNEWVPFLEDLQTELLGEPNNE